MMRHPCERWGNSGRLGQFVFLAVREALYSPAHPDSKRQSRRKQRDLARYGARTLKASSVVSCPLQRINKRREVREMRRRIREEQEKFARKVAARLLGKSWTSVPGGTDGN